MENKHERIEELRKKGFTEDFTAGSSFCIVCNHVKRYKPHQVKIAGYYQCAEGTDETSPSVLYAIETNDGKKGILVATDTNLADKISEFIHVVNVARKQQKKLKFLRAVKWIFRFRFSANI